MPIDQVELGRLTNLVLEPILTRIKESLNAIDALLDESSNDQRLWRTKWALNQKRARRLCDGIRELFQLLNTVLSIQMA